MPALIEEQTNGKPDNIGGSYAARPVHASALFNQTESHGLNHVNVSDDLYAHLYSDEGSQSEKYASIKFVSEADLGEFRVYAIHQKRSLPPNSVEFNNMASLISLKNQITIISCLIVGVPRPPFLTHAILSLPQEVYGLVSNIAKDNLYKILLDDRTHKLYRKDELVRNLNGYIVQCEPVNQGFVTRDTEVTIVKFDRPKVPAASARASLTKDDMLASINFNFQNYFALEEDKPAFLEYRVELLQDKTHLCVPFPDPKHDDEIFAFVKVNELSKIGIFSGDLVEFSTGDAAQKMVLRVFGFTEPNDYGDGTIYMSPIYSINLGSPARISIVTNVGQAKVEIPTAKKVTIARVSSPITLNRTLQHLFLSNLKFFFESKNRVVSTDALIPIPIDTILASNLPSDDNNLPEIIPQGNCDAIAWFKITQIDDEEVQTAVKQYIIDSSFTKMVQSGMVKQAPPDNSSNYYEYLGIGNLFPYSATDAADFKAAKEFAKIVRTSCTRPALRSTILLHSQTRGIGKSFLVSNIATELGVHLIELDGYEMLIPGSDMKTLGVIRGKLDRIVDNCSPLIVHFQHVEALVKQKDQQQSANKQESLVVKFTELIDEYLTHPGVTIVASTCDLEHITPTFRNKFKFEIELKVPSQTERFEIFRFAINDKLTTESDYSFKTRDDVSLETLSLQSAGLTPRDLVSIVETAKDFALVELESMADKLSVTTKQLYYMNGGFVNILPNVFERAINDARNKFSDSIGAPKIPDVKWEDVGGLDLVKDEILDTIDMPMKHPELFANGLKKRSGILFYGPPGTGKTLLAKAIATNFSLNFFSVKGPELLNMYIGESEANVRKVFQKARDSKPCVVFFDELDSVAPKRGNQGDSGGVMDRIVSQLLAELDGMSSSGGDGVFVVGATNRPDLLDDALLRPGRFDKMLYLGISDTDEKQAKILQALTRKFKLDDDLDLLEVAQRCAFNFTGADFYALCSDAILKSMIRLSAEIDAKINKLNAENPAQKISTRYYFEKISTPAEVDVIVKREDFLKALDELNPSVSQDELNHYLNIKRSFEQS